MSLENMKLATFLVIVETGSDKALISNITGQEERKKSDPTKVLHERKTLTWLESRQHPQGVKVQAIKRQWCQ